MDNELTLFDRIEVIKTTNQKYDLENNAYLSFSGGKDSTILHYLLDMALPNNNIPRVYADTGIEYNLIREFVMELAKTDKRIVIIKPSQPIKKTLETYGYPFKSKQHSDWVKRYQQKGMTEFVKNYLNEGTKQLFRPCPNKLKYQFTKDFNIKVSDMCCVKMKEEPLQKWQKENNKAYSILGLMREEGGRRGKIECLAFKRGVLKSFYPLAKVDKEWEEWFIEKYNIKLCKLYYPPYNFKRTGCKGCPFALDLQECLDTMEKYLPNERKQCEVIWKPVYEEYRRLGYRLKKVEEIKLL